MLANLTDDQADWLYYHPAIERSRRLRGDPEPVGEPVPPREEDRASFIAEMLRESDLPREHWDALFTEMLRRQAAHDAGIDWQVADQADGTGEPPAAV